MRRRAFTLVELLVVVGIIAVLIAILMPTLSRARDQANRVKCMSNVRNIMQGIVMYASMNKSSLPYPNWGGNPQGTPGWLYDNPGWPFGSSDPDWSFFENGAIYRLLKERDVFKCPIHTDRVSSGPSEKYTSYLMNGCTNDFGGRPYPVTKFSVMDIIIWETGESDLANRVLGIPPFNDGSSQPREWLSERHGGGGRNIQTGQVKGNGGASVGCVDGHAEWMSYKDYEYEVQKPIAKPGKSRLWIAPGLANGGY